jgi:L-alanine-DL-glutamate epimerase-like enolase superfamily enzyme
MRRLAVSRETWPIRGTFTISRGSKTAAEVVVATITEDGLAGRGECVPSPRYGETVAGVVAEIERVAGDIEAGLEREALIAAMPAGAARNALDCALWDLAAKLSGVPAWRLAGLAAPEPRPTAYTIGLDAPAGMAAAARANADRPLLKLKLGGEGDPARVAAVRQAAPATRLVVDANEAWTEALLRDHLAAMADFGVELVEQPLPAGADAALAGIDRPLPVCADESCHDTASLAGLAGRYDMVNVKLDKTGGLTEALRLVKAAREAGFGLMVGCMVGTSLAMAPATLLAQQAAVVDLDGPLLLAHDRPHGLCYAAGCVHPPTPELWG